MWPAAYSGVWANWDWDAALWARPHGHLPLLTGASDCSLRNICHKAKLSLQCSQIFYLNIVKTINEWSCHCLDGQTPRWSSLSFSLSHLDCPHILSKRVKVLQLCLLPLVNVNHRFHPDSDLSGFTAQLCVSFHHPVWMWSKAALFTLMRTDAATYINIQYRYTQSKHMHITRNYICEPSAIIRWLLLRAMILSPFPFEFVFILGNVTEIGVNEKCFITS